MRRVFMWGCIAAILLMSLMVRLSHPDMSETRLFLEFWPAFVVAAGLGSVAVWLARGL